MEGYQEPSCGNLPKFVRPLMSNGLLRLPEEALGGLAAVYSLLETAEEQALLRWAAAQHDSNELRAASTVVCLLTDSYGWHRHRNSRRHEELMR